MKKCDMMSDKPTSPKAKGASKVIGKVKAGGAKKIRKSS